MNGINNLTDVGDILYRGFNPYGKRDTPSLFYEKLEYHYKKWLDNKGDKDFLKFCLEKYKYELIDSIGMYEREWTGFEMVVKRKKDDYTILIKDEGSWMWYNKDVEKVQHNILTSIYNITKNPIEV